MKRFYILLIILFSTSGVKSQGYENAWINYAQNYYKIKVWQEGIYKIPVTSFLNAGIAVTGMDHRTMQLFRNGQEQYIYIYDQNANSQLDGNDYVEFYGQRNDGSLDTKLYGDSSWQPNSNYSLYTDTAIYFLTFNTSLANRRITMMTDTNYSALSPANYFIKESYKEETGYYNEGATNLYNATEIDYTEAEGWMDGNFSTGASVSKTLNTQNIYTSGPNIEVNTSVAGANSNDHKITINFPGVNYMDTYTGYLMRRYHFSISPVSFSTSSTTFTYSALMPGLPDYNKFVNLSVMYPHTYDLENAPAFKMFVQNDQSQSKTRMDITNFNTGGTPAVVLYDLTNHRRFPVVQSGSTWHAVVDNDLQSKPKTCYIAALNQVQTITSIISAAYVTNNPGLFNNLTVPKDSAYIIITHRSLWNQALYYKTYRDQTTNNKVILIDVAELYDQFAYGIRQHPLAIKNFVKYILDNWTTVNPPQALFLVGKSIAARFTRTNAQNFSNNLVPSFGNPPSDILLTSGLNGTVYEPKIPTGRLSAQSTVQVTDYLQKIQDYETAQSLPPAKWMKEVLHFGGGSNQPEQDLIKYFLNNFKSTIEDTAYGGHVTSYFKTSNAPIFIDQSIELQERINAGVSIMTFFAHASGSDFDQSTDLVENYGNQGKYPIVFANSCFAGDIHTATPSISERFVTLANKGSVGFIASVGLGDAGYLYLYSSNLFKNIAYKNYGQSIGKIMQQTIRDVQDTGNVGTKIVCQEMTLEGDPGLKMNNWNKPDFLMEPSNIYLTPASITTDMDTFTVHVIVRNIAKAVPDSFNVVITRTFPNGIDSVYTRRIAHCNYADTIELSMHVNGYSSAGINTFKSDVDLPFNTVDEIENQFNNTASAFFFISSLDAVPVYPPKFAIVPYTTVALKASTSNPLAGMKSYRFEMDTSYQAFGDPPQYSPMFRFATVTDSGGIITWNNNITLLDSVVYYWRIANDSVQNNPLKYKWRESSFIHIPNKTGWSQKHFYQFNEDKFTNVIPDSINRKFNFVQNTKSLNAITHAALANDVGFTLNNSVTDGEYTNACTVSPSVMIAVIDSITLKAWSTCDHNVGQENTFTVQTGICGDPNPNNAAHGFNTCQSGNINGRNRPENILSFRYNSPGEMLAFKNLMQSGIPNGDYILAYSWNIADYATVDPNFISGLNAAGFQSSSLSPNTPYIFFIQKGHPFSEQHVIGTSSQDTINYSISLTSVWDRGTIVTDLIGPATQWNELHWKEHSLENGNTKDTTALNLYGLNAATNAFDTLRYGIQTASFDTTLSWISASQYPYVKMEVYLKDDSVRTPPQMNKWQIYYDEAPECAVNANHNFSFHGNSISEGDTARLSIAIDNIADKSMDSLTVDFFLFDNNRIRHNLKSIKMDSLRVGQSLLANVEMDTTFGYSGNNSLWVEANPIGTHHQLEQYHFNNLAEVKFKVNRDLINPILDVTFDGIHILDRDIISGKPNITVQLHDENKFLALNDTSDFRVYLKSPSSNTEQRIYFAPSTYGSVMRFTPAMLPKNSCRIDWSPVLTEDGIYTLAVEATDKSKNESGKYNYRISFEVINRSTITEVLNYPNPFSTSTRFVFTLTGNVIPGYMKIQIMTVTGKIIREITQNELGNIHIGRNITDYAWNGKDEYGDQLANGVYLYRVITTINGDAIEHRETEVDKFFKKGWGKLYLMR